MKFLKCKLCMGECELIGNDRSIFKKIKCTKCGFTNVNDTERKKTEVVIIRRPIRPV